MQVDLQNSIKIERQFFCDKKYFSDNKIFENVIISEHNLALHSNDGIAIYIYKTHPTDVNL